MNYVNLHGHPITGEAIRAAEAADRRARLMGVIPPRRKPTVKNGYAAPPGTGPSGQTCKGCAHKRSMVSQGGSKRFIKCELRAATWTHGPGTDILASTPACNKFEPKP